MMQASAAAEGDSLAKGEVRCVPPASVTVSDRESMDQASGMLSGNQRYNQSSADASHASGCRKHTHIHHSLPVSHRIREAREEGSQRSSRQLQMQGKRREGNWKQQQRHHLRSSDTCRQTSLAKSDRRLVRRKPSQVNRRQAKLLPPSVWIKRRDSCRCDQT